MIDDNQDVIESLTKTVQWSKANCILVGSATDGEEGLSLALDINPDIILTDIRMPGLNGLDFAKRLQDNKKTSLIIFITGYAEFEYAHRALTLGAFGYILKPIDNDELIMLLSSAVDYLDNIKNYDRMKAENEAQKNIIDENFHYIIGSILRECLEGNPLSIQKTKNIEIEKNYYVFCIGNHTGEDFNAQVQNALQIYRHKSFRIAAASFNGSEIVLLFMKQDIGLETARSCVEELLKIAGISNNIQYVVTSQSDNFSQIYEIASLMQQKLLTETKKLTPGKPTNLPEEILWDSLSPLVRLAVQYISENISVRLSLSDVSDYVGLSPNYLSMLLHKETGIKFSVLLTKMKTEEAKRLLQDPTIKIYEIGLLLGYEDYSYFYQVFHKATGLSPKEYREQYT